MPKGNDLTEVPGVRSYAEQVAQHRGWVVNADRALTDPILEGLASQTKRFGRPFCPCRDIEEGRNNQDVVCPCRYASEDIAQYGQCYCGLFLTPEKDPQTVGSIPERRPEES
jgi:ferredoxin-thioredoxin reductase catalytic subunit